MPVILQTLIKFIISLSQICGLAIMVVCTIFVIVCIIRGDIRVNISRSETGNEEKE